MDRERDAVSEPAVAPRRLRWLRIVLAGGAIITMVMAVLISTDVVQVRTNNSAVFVTISRQVGVMAYFDARSGSAAVEVVRYPPPKHLGVNVIRLDVGRQNALKIGKD